MNKKDLIPAIILMLMIPLWVIVDQKYIAPKFARRQPEAKETRQNTQKKHIPSLPAETHLKEAASVEVAKPTQLPEPESVTHEEKLATIENDVLYLELSTWGGAIRKAILKKYPELNKKNSKPVVLDFSDKTYALTYSGLKGIGPGDPLTMHTSPDGECVTFSKVWNSGLRFERKISINDDYLVNVEDRFINDSSNPWNLPALRIVTGRMRNPAHIQKIRGFPTLGVDSYTPAGGIDYWGRKLHRFFGPADTEIDYVPPSMKNVEVDWISAKNKFFTQILRPDEPLATMSILSSKKTPGKKSPPVDVAGALNFKPEVIEAHSEYDLNYSYYVGPKKYSILKACGNNMEGVMEFETVGFWSFMNIIMEPARKFLLFMLNKFYSIIPNYGIATILLTVLIRVLFWPLTHKSTESMKKMQELQPEIAKLKAKYEKNPQKLQQETMLLYKKHKVNPMGGCLPMFIQIPVFFALYSVLRNAIELRYSGFLWIRDLSSPENLFAPNFPIFGALNILPLLMTATMIWQQKLTPSSGDPNQKTMMYVMPLMMLFLFYNMPSGLVLYWTTSQLLMIAQMLIRNLRQNKANA